MPDMYSSVHFVRTLEACWSWVFAEIEDNRSRSGTLCSSE